MLQNLPTRLSKTLETTNEWLLLVLSALAPIFVIPIFDSFLFSSKSLLIQALALYVAFCYILKSCIDRSFSFPQSRISGTLLVFTTMVIASSITSQPYPVENLLGIGGILISAAVIAIFGSTLISPSKGSQKIVLGLKIGLLLLSLLTLLQLVGFRTQSLLTPFLSQKISLDSPVFNFTGSLFIAWQAALVGAVASIVVLLRFKQRDPLSLAVLGVTAATVILGGIQLLPGKESAPVILPPLVNWAIATDVLKSPQGALLGVGPEQFLTAFANFKPAWTNTTSWWNIQFLQGSTVALTYLTTLGLLGVGSWIALGLALLNRAWKVESDNRTHRQEVTFLAVIAASIWIAQIFFPFNSVLVIMQCFALAAWLSHSTMAQLKPAVSTFTGIPLESSVSGAKRSSQFFVLFLGLILALGLSFISWFFGKSVAALYYTQQASIALADNKVSDVYNNQKIAVQLNPFLPASHRTYALTNMAIATALSNKTDASEQDKQQALQLVQQSIREARAASSINPKDYRNWKVLAQVYRDLIGSAKDAQQWTVSAYVAAIQQAPTDPILRLELGGIFFNQSEYSQALSLFQQSIELKPDYANAYYNAANALVKLGNLAEAKRMYQQTLTLLTPDSEGYVTATEELKKVDEELQKQELNKKADTKTAPAPTAETTPSLLEENLKTTPESLSTEPITQTEITPTTTTPSPTTDSAVQ